MKALVIAIALLLVGCEGSPSIPDATIAEIGTCAQKTWSSGYSVTECAVKLSDGRYAVCEQPMEIGMRYVFDVRCE